MGRLTPTLTFVASVIAGCVGSTPTPEHAGRRVAVEVAPLSLTGISDATYTLTVLNDDDDVVWSRQLTSIAYGDGAGSVSYVGPCDAEANPNTVQLVVDELRDADGALTAGVDYMNPAPSGAPLTLDAVCSEGGDVAVAFEISFARAARQGFFDVAVELDDVFCSAKLDCEDGEGQPLRLLHDADGVRSPTAVFAFACTGGAGADTHLYLSDLRVDCGGDVLTLDPSLGPGKLSVVTGSGLPNAHLFDALVTRGDEQLGTYAKRYWNVALGLEDVSGCALSATGTASDGALTDGATPAGAIWPYIAWDQADLGGCTRHALNGADGVVAVEYTGFSGATFAHGYDGAPLLPPVIDDGSSAAAAATTCATLHAAYPELDSGRYWIDPDGEGGVDPFEVWCEMSVEGGGWTLFAYHADQTSIAVAAPVLPSGSYGVVGDASWVALRDAFTDGMMFIDEDGDVSRISRQKIWTGNCTSLSEIASLVPGHTGASPDGTLWRQENSGCGNGGTDYSLIVLRDASAYGACVYQYSNVKFDLWPYGGNVSYGAQNDLEYYLR